MWYQFLAHCALVINVMIPDTRYFLIEDDIDMDLVDNSYRQLDESDPRFGKSFQVSYTRLNHIKFLNAYLSAYLH